MLVWPEAVIPAVSEEEEEEFKRLAGTAEWDPRQCGEDEERDDQEVATIKKEIRGRKAYMQLDYLAVHPDNQGKGIGTALVQSGMIEAAKLNLDIFILAFKAGLGLYKRLGFRVEREIVQDDSKYGGPGDYRTYFMIYEQNPTSN